MSPLTPRYPYLPAIRYDDVFAAQELNNKMSIIETEISIFFISIIFTTIVSKEEKFTIIMASTYNLKRESLFDLSGKVALVTGTFSSLVHVHNDI